MEQPIGKRVTVKTKERSYTGLCLPRAELLSGNALVLKLDSGYNIGINQSRIESVDVEQEQPASVSIKKNPIQHNPELPTVALISCGGTISSKLDYKTGGTHADYTAEDFLAMTPELATVANIKPIPTLDIMSEDMTPEHWKVMAQAVHKELCDPTIKGVVVTQGTDTLHFSTAFLSFALAKLNKPVVFTASQRSIDRGSTDAFMNLQCAVHAACADIVEVMTCLHETTNDDTCLLVRGSRVRKMHTSRRDAFRPIGERALARITPKGKLTPINEQHTIRNRNAPNPVLCEKFETKTALVTVYPGMDPSILNVFIEKNYKGLVVAATALGHIPSQVHDKIKHLTSNGCVVVVASQTIYGRVHPHVYANLRKLSIGADVVFAQDMMPEVAYAKLGWLLAHSPNTNEVKSRMTQSIAGEITTRSDTEGFLA